MRKMGLIGMTLLMAAGCSSSKRVAMDPMTQPKPAPELAQLSRFVGEWAGRAEFVEPSYEAMQASMPEGEEMPRYFNGAASYEWTLGGRALRLMGWYEMGEGKRKNYEGMMTWDPKEEVYRSWGCDDWGGRWTATFTLDEDGKTFHEKSEHVDGYGNKGRGEGTMSFQSNDTIVWTWTSKGGPMGKMKLKGTDKRVH